MELNEMRKTAEAATPGPWEAYDLGIGYEVYQSGSDWCLNSGQRETFSKSDATHIAAFDPPTVLALLSRLEQAEQAVARVREVAAGWATNDRPFREAILRALDGDGRG